jgi:hypothetical protein
MRRDYRPVRQPQDFGPGSDLVSCGQTGSYAYEGRVAGFTRQTGLERERERA